MECFMCGFRMGKSDFAPQTLILLLNKIKWKKKFPLMAPFFFLCTSSLKFNYLRKKAKHFIHYCAYKTNTLSHDWMCLAWATHSASAASHLTHFTFILTPMHDRSNGVGVRCLFASIWRAHLRHNLISSFKTQFDMVYVDAVAYWGR